MRKIFTFIIFGLVLSPLLARQLSIRASGILAAGNLSSSAISYAYPQAFAHEVPEANFASKTAGIENTTEAPQIRLYPNPAGDQIQVTVNDRILGHTLRIYSLLGNEMLSHTLDYRQSAVDVSGLSQGLYLYSIIDKNNKTVVSGKFNKQ